jgi:mRNA interferase RelE/StbE
VAYRVIWHKSAAQNLLALHSVDAKRIVKKVESHLAQNPQMLGLAMRGDFSGFYRYRIGDYRVIYEIAVSEITIHVIKVGHRKDVYEN